VRTRPLTLLAFAFAAVALPLITACGAGHGGGPVAGGRSRTSSNAPVAICGKERTGAGVPVTVEVARGSTSCATAQQVERGYLRALASGKVPGNGGGAPVKVGSWICQGYNTPQLLATGDASACHSAGAQILAVLATPTPSPT
jgi:hypothetical protein